MKKLTFALAIVLGMNLLISMTNLTVPVGLAQENPAPEPEKPDTPGD